MIRAVLPAVVAITLAAVVLQPIHSRTTIAATLLLALCLLGALVWLRRRLFWWLVAVVAIALIPFALPGSPDPAVIKAGYLKRLRASEGIAYVWGGEGWLGIDCSGLPRRAMIGSLLAYGYANLDGAALRQALGLWLADASARHMLEGYGGRMTPIGPPFAINRSEDEPHPGDLAITVGGVHVMVYLDRSTIIQADPGRDAVVIDVIPGNSPWYDQPVRLVRWNLLNAP